MTIDEAIEILRKEARHFHYLPDWKKEGAVKLGIEALKRIQIAREHAGYFGNSPLPGED